MPIDVDLTVEWDYADGVALVPDAEIASLLLYALTRESKSGDWTFAIRFVGDEEMCRLHEAWLGDPSPTDIMTFPYDEDDGEQGGDILISIDTAAANASEHDWDTTDELRFLVLHGMLHILGWDDRDEGDRSAMLDRQQELLSAWSGERRAAL